MNKAKMDKLAFFGVMAILGIFVLGFVGIGPVHFSTTSSAPTVTSSTTPVTAVNSCPTDGITTLNLALKNSLNTSAQYLGETFHVFDAQGNYITSVTTTAGAARTFATVNVDCGQSYTLYGVTDATSNAKLIGASGTGVSLLTGDNGITVNANGNNEYINLIGTAHANAVQVRLYDNTNRAFYFNNTATTNTQWISVANGGVATFMTTVSNSTLESVGANGEVSMTLGIRAATNYQDANDMGLLILVGAGTSAAKDWNDFSITYNGKSYSSQMAELTPYEQRRFSGYNWAFIVNQPLRKTPTTQIGITMDATSNVPASNITVLVASRGQFLNAGNTKMLIGAAKDDTSYSQVVSEFKVVKTVN